MITEQDMADQLKKDAAVFLQYKTTEGYKLLLKLARGHQANLFRELLSDGEIDEVQVRANLKAWHSLLEVIDQTIVSYDDYLANIQRIQKEQEQKAKGFNYG